MLMPYHNVIFGDRIVRLSSVLFARTCLNSTRPKAAPAPHDPENSHKIPHTMTEQLQPLHTRDGEA